MVIRKQICELERKRLEKCENMMDRNPVSSENRLPKSSNADFRIMYSITVQYYSIIISYPNPKSDTLDDRVGVVIVNLKIFAEPQVVRQSQVCATY
jgi:hypothetical protein